MFGPLHPGLEALGGRDLGHPLVSLTQKSLSCAPGPVSDSHCPVGFVWLSSPLRCGDKAGSSLSFVAESKSPLHLLSK